MDDLVRLYNEGKLDKAYKKAQSIISSSPENYIAWNILGAIEALQGRFHEAMTSFTQVIVLQPDYAEAHNNLGTSLKSLKKWHHAINHYQKAIALKPDYAIAFNNLGSVYKNLGRLFEALSHFQKAISLNPILTEAYINLSITLHQLERWEQSVEYFKKVLLLDPKHVSSYFNLGVTLTKLENWEEAISFYNKAISLKPDYAQAYNNLGVALFHIDKIDESIEPYEIAISLNPDYVDAYFNLAISLRSLDCYDGAIRSLNKAKTLAPLSTKVYQELGSIYKNLGDYKEALHHYDQVINLNPEQPEVYNSLGNLYNAMEEWDKSLIHYQHAIKLKPDYINCFFNLSLTQLSTFNFVSGWENFKFRYHPNKKNLKDSIHYFPNTRKNFYSGQEIKDKTLYIYSEQGHGDMILMSRFFNLLTAKGAKVLFYSHHRALIKLFEYNFPQVLIMKMPFEGEYDFHMPFMDVCGALGMTHLNMPLTDGYLSTNKETEEGTLLHHFNTDKIKVGVVWKGNPSFGDDKFRSLSLEKLLKKLKFNNKIQLFSLQKEVNEAEKVMLAEHHIIDLGNDFNDFYDTASVMQKLDLLISTDTACAHLGGALGIKTWILLSRPSSWQWGRKDSTSYWYDSVTLFRQSEFNDWQTVFDNINAALIHL